MRQMARTISPPELNAGHPLLVFIEPLLPPPWTKTLSIEIGIQPWRLLLPLGLGTLWDLVILLSVRIIGPSFFRARSGGGGIPFSRERHAPFSFPSLGEDIIYLV